MDNAARLVFVECVELCFGPCLIKSETKLQDQTKYLPIQPTESIRQSRKQTSEVIHKASRMKRKGSIETPGIACFRCAYLVLRNALIPPNSCLMTRVWCCLCTVVHMQDEVLPELKDLIKKQIFTCECSGDLVFVCDALGTNHSNAIRRFGGCWIGMAPCPQFMLCLCSHAAHHA